MISKKKCDSAEEKKSKQMENTKTARYIKKKWIGNKNNFFFFFERNKKIFYQGAFEENIYKKPSKKVYSQKISYIGKNFFEGFFFFQKIKTMHSLFFSLFISQCVCLSLMIEADFDRFLIDNPLTVLLEESLSSHYYIRVGDEFKQELNAQLLENENLLLLLLSNAMKKRDVEQTCNSYWKTGGSQVTVCF